MLRGGRARGEKVREGCGWRSRDGSWGTTYELASFLVDARDGVPAGDVLPDFAQACHEIEELLHCHNDLAVLAQRFLERGSAKTNERAGSFPSAEDAYWKQTEFIVHRLQKGREPMKRTSNL